MSLPFDILISVANYLNDFERLWFYVLDKNLRSTALDSKTPAVLRKKYMVNPKHNNTVLFSNLSTCNAPVKYPKLQFLTVLFNKGAKVFTGLTELELRYCGFDSVVFPEKLISLVIFETSIKIKATLPLSLKKLNIDASFSKLFTETVIPDLQELNCKGYSTPIPVTLKKLQLSNFIGVLDLKNNTALEELNLFNCRNVINIPASVIELTLFLTNPNFIVDASKFPDMKKLLTDCGVINTHESEIHTLEATSMRGCKPGKILDLTVLSSKNALKFQNLRCLRVKYYWGDLPVLKHLHTLTIDKINLNIYAVDLSEFTGLKKLSVTGNGNNTLSLKLPISLQKLNVEANIQTWNVNTCVHLQSFSSKRVIDYEVFGQLPELHTLKINGWQNFSGISKSSLKKLVLFMRDINFNYNSIQDFENLQYLEIIFCNPYISPKCFKLPKSLRYYKKTVAN